LEIISIIIGLENKMSKNFQTIEGTNLCRLTRIPKAGHTAAENHSSKEKRECEKELKIKILDFQFLFFHFFLWNGFHTRSPTFISLLTAAGGKKLVPAVNNMKVYTRE